MLFRSASFKNGLLSNLPKLNDLYIPYISKDEKGNKITTMFNFTNSTEASVHIGERVSKALMNKSKLIADINYAKNLEELEAININF